ncbi:hypothetical protein ASPVEDRAFT_84532 [Aspergillus versicolor CBS 583.65]|uniref:Arrestin-like N-terminal domain-containing protein n=1 Tax=Aspergillus versicolor CBS 583.65 TaxID=1036611 RepID=A0A1L9PNH2_ASPVE|nr:uncharacterized protein ASPVEDRAFT_84532 [Aspergillus versicolor CBS 583.65]OJJ03069.1 hypothetical protein ASPVEDRAFT_84532 [Aspergillus versicolor CBS 583.65]
MAVRSLFPRCSALWPRRSSPKASICLVEDQAKAYSPLDQIEGRVTVTVGRETRFDEIHITFEGTSQVIIWQPAAHEQTITATQTFLTQQQPIEKHAYPTPRAFEPGRSYEFPFIFIIPEFLLPQSCTHKKDNAGIQRSHTRIPPTVVLDTVGDMTCRISYAIHVDVSMPWGNDQTTHRLAVAVKELAVIPASGEREGSDTVNNPRAYCAQTLTEPNGGFMRRELGRLLAVASASKPIQFLHPECYPNQVLGNGAVMNLRFEPVRDVSPPQLEKLYRKLRILTFYSSTPWEDYPSMKDVQGLPHRRRGVVVKTIPLSTLHMGSVHWTRTLSTNCSASNESTQPSELSLPLESLADPSGPSGPSWCYTTSVVVPVSLPTRKNLIPTFHSCFVSRIYELELRLSYHMPNDRVAPRNVTVEVPVQFTHEKARDQTVSYLSHVSEETRDQTSHSLSLPNLQYAPHETICSTPDSTSDSSGHGHVLPPPTYPDCLRI